MENQEFVKYRGPLEYTKILFRRKWLFISPIFVGFILSIVACFILPPTYESSTVILVEEEKIINPLIEGLAVSSSVAQRMQTLREQILSWKSLVELTKKLKLAEDVKTQGQFEGLIASLRKNIIVQMRGPNLIKLSFYDQKPEKAQIVTKTLTDIFIEENMRSQTKETGVAIDFITEQLRVYKRKIKESEIAKMEEQLKDLLVDSTEEHPLVKDLRQKINAARKELGSDGYQITESEQPIINPAYESLKQELDKIITKGNEAAGSPAGYAQAKDQPQGDDSSLYKLILMDKIDSVLARDVRVNENIYNMLLQKLETAKITQSLETSKEGTRYTIIDPPRLPLKPVKPNKLIVIFLGIFFGGCAGVGLVFGREFMDFSFLDIEELKQNLEYPVLGAISRITTQEEIEKEKNNQRRLITIAAVASLVIILIAMLYAAFGR